MPGTRRTQPHPTAVQLPIYVPTFVLQHGVDYIAECIRYGPTITLHHLDALCALVARYPARLPAVVPEPHITNPQWSVLIKATLQNAIGAGAQHWTIGTLDQPWTVLKIARKPTPTPDYLTALGITLAPQ